MQESLTQEKLLLLCYAHAQYSPDKSNQNGAIVASDDGLYNSYTIISYGINQFLPNVIVPTVEMINNREIKLQNIEHAERSAIYNASQFEPLKGKVLFCPWFACTDCARAIVLSGIKEVVGHQQRMNLTPTRWKNSIETGLKMLKENRVKLTFYDGKLGTVPIFVNGELISL